MLLVLNLRLKLGALALPLGPDLLMLYPLGVRILGFFNHDLYLLAEPTLMRGGLMRPMQALSLVGTAYRGIRLTPPLSPSKRDRPS